MPTTRLPTLAHGQHHSVQLRDTALQTPGHGGKDAAGHDHQAAKNCNQEYQQLTLLLIRHSEFVRSHAQIDTGIGSHIGHTGGQFG